MKAQISPQFCRMCLQDWFYDILARNAPLNRAEITFSSVLRDPTKLLAGQTLCLQHATLSISRGFFSPNSLLSTNRAEQLHRAHIEVEGAWMWRDPVVTLYQQ